MPADGEDGVDAREHPEPGLSEVVLQALEDERRVLGVGLHHRDLGGEAVGGALRDPSRRVGVARGDVDARHALVELGGGRDLAGDEAEVVADAGDERIGGEAEGDAIGRLREHHGGEPEQQIEDHHVAVRNAQRPLRSHPADPTTFAT